MNENRNQIETTAEQAAEYDANKIIWFLAGLVLSIIGVLIAYIYQQPPPASRFIDKSNEYTLIFSDAYRTRLRSIQVKYSVIGFFISAALGLLYIVYMFSFYRRIMQQFWIDF